MIPPSSKRPLLLDAIKREIARRKALGSALLPTTARYWPRLKDLFQIIDAGSPPLHVATFNGGLFDGQKHQFFEHYTVCDAHLLAAIDKLACVNGEYVDYRDLAERHLGTIYEGLLEYHRSVALRKAMPSRMPLKSWRLLRR